MDLKARLFLGGIVGLSTYLAFLVAGQIELAYEAMKILKSCGLGQIPNCVDSEEYTRLVNRWDGNVKVYWVLAFLCALVVGHFSPKIRKK